jgi:Putative prokaryotic signal transducing protein
MGDLVVVETASSEQEAKLICSILEGEGIECFDRPTNQAVGAGDGLAFGGSREVVVRAEDAQAAHDVLELQRRQS